jgi:hypothetical protein
MATGRLSTVIVGDCALLEGWVFWPPELVGEFGSAAMTAGLLFESSEARLAECAL